jgi:hypothetical protein
MSKFHELIRFPGTERIFLYRKTTIGKQQNIVDNEQIQKELIHACTSINMIDNVRVTKYCVWLVLPTAAAKRQPSISLSTAESTQFLMYSARKCPILTKFGPLKQVFVSLQYMEISPVGAKLINADGQT